MNYFNGDSLDELTLWFKCYLIDHLGDDFAFNRLMGNPAGGQSGYDRLTLWRDIVTDLTNLLGSEKAASDWMFHGKAFKSISGYAPFDYLESGEFEALALLHTIVRISASQHSGESGLAHNFATINSTLPDSPEAWPADPTLPSLNKGHQ